MKSKIALSKHSKTIIVNLLEDRIRRLNSSIVYWEHEIDSLRSSEHKNEEWSQERLYAFHNNIQIASTSRDLAKRALEEVNNEA